MKNLRLLIVVMAIFATTSLSAQKIDFPSLVVDYGQIEQGADGLREFSFTNAGTESLVITSATGSCGCTVPSYPKEPIEAGATSAIQVRYDTNRIGSFTKTVTLTTNDTANPTVRLTIKGTVLQKQPSGK
jgi:hypothetical protein